jgi:carboxyl-terminal processing protease
LVGQLRLAKFTFSKRGFAMPMRNLVSIFLAAIVSYGCYSVAVKKQGYASKFAEVVDLVQREALHEFTDEELFDDAIGGLMGSLDEHSMYFSGRDFEEFDNDLKQQFGGVGMYVDINPANDRLTVMSPIPSSPAQRAGVRSGDIIDEIDGVSTKNMTRNDAVEKMRGPIETSVTVTFLRGDKQLERTLTRKLIPVPSVRGDRRNEDASWKYFLEGHERIGYVHVIQFGEKTSAELAGILQKLDKTTDALIVDLRNNTGGYMDSAIEVSDMFLDGKYKIIETRRRGGVLEDEYFTRKGCWYSMNKPVVFLVNRFSASASEIVSACLQDHGRAVVVGERTWGKGTVQNVIPIDRGRSALKLTVASYWRPSGENIDRSVSELRNSQDWGVKPNNGFEIKLTEEQLFDNMRMRNQRSSLLAPDAKENGVSGSGNSKSDDGNKSAADQNKSDGKSAGAKSGDDKTSNEKNGNDQSADDSNPNEIPPLEKDPVIKRALEYLKNRLQKNAAA